MTRSRMLIAISVIAATLLALSVVLLAHGPQETPASQDEFAVSGLVDNELTITMDNLTAMADTDVQAELVQTSGESLGTHVWTGVKLKDILGEASVQSDAIKVAFYSANGESTDLTVSDAMRDDVIVAVLMDGNPIQGGTQLVVPGKLAYKWISGIVDIQLVDYDFKGTYESVGYSDDATIRMPPSDHGPIKAP